MTSIIYKNLPVSEKIARFPSAPFECFFLVSLILISSLMFSFSSLLNSFNSVEGVADSGDAGGTLT